MKFHLGIESDDGKDVMPVSYESPGHYNNLAIFDGEEKVVGNDEYDVFHDGLKREFYLKLLLASPELLSVLKEVGRRVDLVDVDQQLAEKVWNLVERIEGK